jgi:hypothetical protein
VRAAPAAGIRARTGASSPASCCVCPLAPHPQSMGFGGPAVITLGSSSQSVGDGCREWDAREATWETKSPHAAPHRPDSRSDVLSLCGCRVCSQSIERHLDGTCSWGGSRLS